VTGHSGFTGRHLVPFLRSLGHDVLGFDRSSDGDIRDADVVRRSTYDFRPEVVYHLAGLLRSDDPREMYSVNVIGTVTLLDAVEHLDPAPRIILASSSAVYGRVRTRRPIVERDACRPITHYGASKLAQEQVAIRYHDARRLPIVRARAFNLLGPGLPTTMACGSFVDQIVTIEEEAADRPLRTGNLDAKRDFVDVRDVVRAYALLAERGRAGQAYNVSSGKAISIRACVDVLRAMSTSRIGIELDPVRRRTDDVAVQVGDPGRLLRRTGWSSAITFEQSMADMLEHRRNRQE